MKFVVEATYSKDEEKMLQCYPFLREYGFETVEVEYKCRIIKVSYIYINTLEELLRLYEQCSEELVITKDIFTDEKCIEIYDGYRE
jgi:hypothetical protein